MKETLANTLILQEPAPARGTIKQRMTENPRANFLLWKRATMRKASLQSVTSSFKFVILILRSRGAVPSRYSNFASLQVDCL